eukprot:CAMPEP_0194218562 /NCGR_PEP_ID=MMETSP0156-20130528/24038_1 /TAXON_ID=33649 /ORGANISM="Thalassionema nitzschioides, Strain L26-B" /LENGTH=141 /DNA_ID=CAMNT_0038947965 /DNA_START=24 /DNA_END=445 /DNA_ORIENTATION=-
MVNAIETTEDVSITFKDVWEEKKTGTALVDYLITAEMGDETLDQYFKNGKELPEMKPFLDELVSNAPFRLLAKKFLCHCAVISNREPRKRTRDDGLNASSAGSSGVGCHLMATKSRRKDKDGNFTQHLFQHRCKVCGGKAT